MLRTNVAYKREVKHSKDKLMMIQNFHMNQIAKINVFPLNSNSHESCHAESTCSTFPVATVPFPAMCFTYYHRRDLEHPGGFSRQGSHGSGPIFKKRCATNAFPVIFS